ncbi:YfhO family protein [Methylocella sp.]|uniref:YfhO family protein n=1 Tax=Methylocella sp. TaxID=1978226 RepID=UPI0035B3B4EC
MSFPNTIAAPLGVMNRKQLGRLDALEGASAPAWTARETACALSAVLAFCVAAFALWLAAGAVVPWDSKNHFYPMFRFLGDALRHGAAPLWNPYHFAGHPAAADPQSLLFTPTMALFAFVAPNASMQTFDAVILSHLAFGGLCMVGLARRWRWRPAGGVLAAIVYMLGGAASARLQHTGMILSYAFFPAALWALDAMMERRTIASALAFGALACLMTLGRDQVAFLMVLTLAGRALYAAAESGAPLAFIRARLGVFALAAATILLFLAPPALLTLQFLDESNRPGIAFGVAAAGSLAPVNLMTLAAPNFFGSLDHAYDYWGPAYDTMAKADWTDRAVDYLYIGAFPALLIFWHGLGAGRLLARKARFFLILAGFALLYSLGRYTPFFSFAFDWLPGVSLYRRPADATFILNIALAFGAGYLLHRYELDGLPRARALGARLGPLAAGATALAVAAAAASGLGFSRQEGRLLASLESLALASAFAGAAAVLLVAFRGTPRARAACAALFTLATAGELLWRNAASPLNAEPVSRYSVYAQMTPAEAGALAVLRREIEARRLAGDHPRVEILGLPGPWQNASMMLKLENTVGYNPLRIEDYERAVGPGDNAGDVNLRHFPGTFRGYDCRLARLLGLEYLILDRPLAKLPRHVPRPKARLIYSAGGIYVYRLRDAAPRAYFTSRIKASDDERALEEQSLPQFDAPREALIDDASLPLLRSLSPQAPDAPDAREADAGGRARIVASSDNAVTLEVDADRDGVVVLHDPYYPGWEARVDGERTPILKANMLFRGVEVGPGHHRIEFVFRPFSLANLAAAAGALAHKHEDN